MKFSKFRDFRGEGACSQGMKSLRNMCVFNYILPFSLKFEVKVMQKNIRQTGKSPTFSLNFLATLNLFFLKEMKNETKL